MQTPAIRPTPASPASSSSPTRFPFETWAVRLLIALSLVFSLVPVTLTMGNDGPQAGHAIAEGSAIRQIQFGSLFLLAFWLAWQHRYWTLKRVQSMNPFLLLLVAYCGLTLLWTPYPDITFKRLVLLAGVVLIGIASSPPTGGSRQFLRVVMATLTILVAVSCVVSIALPHVGVDYALGGAWRGIMWQKNGLGAISGFCTLLWLREWLTVPANRRRSTLGILLCLFVLVMSKSSTSLLATVLGIACYLLTRRQLIGGRHTGLIASLGLLLVVLYAALLSYMLLGRLPDWDDLTGPVSALFNKSTDLTGRSEIWRLLWIAIDQHPIWGIGYGAFWTGDGGPAQYITNLFGWTPAHGHNGYLDLLNELGYVGLSLFACMLLWHCIALIKLFRLDREDAAIHTALFIATLLGNISESEWLRDVAFQNMIFIYSSITISSRLLVHRLQRQAPPTDYRTEPLR